MSRIGTILVLFAGCVCGAVMVCPAYAAAPMHDHELPLAFVELARDIRDDQATVHLLVDWKLLGGRLEEAEVETLQRRYFADMPTRVSHVLLLAELPERGFEWLRDAGHDVGEWVALVRFSRPIEPPPLRRSEQRRDDSELPPPPPPPAILQGTPTTGAPAGSLSGKTVYLSPGHGWTWDPGLKRWRAQRGNTHDIVEDFVNAEGALHYLVPMLHNAGAKVVGVRETDMQPLMTIVDDGGGTGSGYGETGTWQKGAEKGFAVAKAPYLNGVNPFELGGYRAAKAVKAKTSTSTATFVGTFPKAGRYGVHIGYTAGSNRVADAHFEIRHAGGVSHRYIDMRKHGQTWHWLGDFWFEAGKSPSKGAVILHNDTAGDATGKYVIADVVRFGGGMGEISRGNGKPPQSGKTTHRPRWESCARYYTQYAGAPKAVYDYISGTSDGSDDVGARSRFAAWHHEGKDPAIYLSWHSNAPSPARGTSTYVYAKDGPGKGAPFAGTKGSDTFAKMLQANMVKAIRDQYDPKWKDRGVKTAWFGEVNPKHNPEMPAALIESAFHSTKEDADYLRRPRFRHLLARAMVRSITQYFAKVDGVPLKLAPEPPTAVSARYDHVDKKIVVSWKAGKSGGIFGDAASAHIVQQSADGLAFDGGVSVTGSSLSVPVSKVGQARFFRVLAANDGGVSLPSSVVGAVPGCGPSEALFVQGFTRMSASQLPRDDLSKWALKSVQRLRQWKMNTFDYGRMHLQWLAAAGVSVDGIERDAFQSHDISTYELVDWSAGEQSTEDVVWSAKDRGKLGDWLNGGKGRALLASGSEIAWAVGAKGGKSAADWLATWFGAAYAGDDAQTYDVKIDSAVPGAAAGSSLQLCDGGPTCAAADYDVDWPDQLKLVGAKQLASYVGGKGGIAAAHYTAGGSRTALLGFPLASSRVAAHGQSLTKSLVQLLEVSAAGFVCDDKPSAADQDLVDGGSDADAGGSPQQDAGTAPDTSELPDTAAPDSRADADVAGEDASSAGRGVDAAQDIAMPADLVVTELGQGLAADDDGCGCDVRGPRQPPTWGALVWILLCAVAIARRRFGAAIADPRDGP